MTSFCMKRLVLENFRCFETLDLELEEDLTILFAENGGGKTALLSALAMGLSAFQPGSPKDARPGTQRDPRMIALDERGRREPAGPCTITWTADVGEAGIVDWSTTLTPATGRASKKHREVTSAINSVRSEVPGVVPGQTLPQVVLASEAPEVLGRLRPLHPAIARLAKVSEIVEGDLAAPPPKSAAAVAAAVRLFVPLEGLIDVEAEKKRLAKKIAIADYLGAHMVDPVFTNPGMYSSLETLAGVYGYAFQIYADFSAYSDIA